MPALSHTPSPPLFVYTRQAPAEPGWRVRREPCCSITMRSTSSKTIIYFCVRHDVNVAEPGAASQQLRPGRTDLDAWQYRNRSYGLLTQTSNQSQNGLRPPCSTHSMASSYAVDRTGCSLQSEKYSTTSGFSNRCSSVAWTRAVRTSASPAT